MSTVWTSASVWIAALIVGADPSSPLALHANAALAWYLLALERGEQVRSNPDARRIAAILDDQDPARCSAWTMHVAAVKDDWDRNAGTVMNEADTRWTIARKAARNLEGKLLECAAAEIDALPR